MQRLKQNFRLLPWLLLGVFFFGQAVATVSDTLKNFGSHSEYEWPTERAKRHTYIRVGGAYLPGSRLITPAVSIGRTYHSGHGQLEAGFLMGNNSSSEDTNSFVFYFPDVTYKYFVQTNQKAHYYVGAGVSAGRIEKENTHSPKYDSHSRYYSGLFGNAVVGCAFNQMASIQPHVEFKVYQGLLHRERLRGLSMVPMLSIGVTF